MRHYINGVVNSQVIISRIGTLRSAMLRAAYSYETLSRVVDRWDPDG